MKTFTVTLPDDHYEALILISTALGESTDLVIRGALENTFIMSEEQRKTLEKPLPF